MSKNKAKPQKQPPPIVSNPQPEPIKLTKQQKITNLIDQSNQVMYQSIQSGDTNIVDVDAIAQTIVRAKQDSVLDQILNGEFQINPETVPYNIYKKSKQKLAHFHNSQSDFQDQPIFKTSITSNDHSQISRINASLKQLQDSIRRQRQMEKNQSRKLQQKAKEFINKVQKEKELFQEKLKSKRSSSRLFVRAYSQDTIRVMKDKLAQRVQEKKDQLAQKLQNIEKRKAQRLEQSVNGQLSYWEKVRQYQSCKNLKKQDDKRDNLLPQIKYQPSSSSKSTSRGKNYQKEKNHFLKRFLREEKAASVLENKFHQIDQYVIKAKLKLHQFNNSKNQQINSRFKLLQNTGNNNTNHQNFEDLYISNKSYLSSNIDHSEHKFNAIDKLRQDWEQSKINIKMQKLEEKKMMMRNNSKSSLKMHGELSPLMGSSSKEINPEVDNLSVNASVLKPGKNPNQSLLQDSWNLVLNKMRFHDLTKVEGLAQLSQIQKRLDKYDKDGIVNRLKSKAIVIGEIEKEKAELTVSKVVQEVKVEKEEKEEKGKQKAKQKQKQKAKQKGKDSQKVKQMEKDNEKEKEKGKDKLKEKETEKEKEKEKEKEAEKQKLMKQKSKQISKLTVQPKGVKNVSNVSNVSQQKVKGLDSSENEFISKQFKNKVLGKG